MKITFRLLVWLLGFSLLLAACGTAPSTTTTTSPSTPAAAPVKLNVFAAASLTESFNEMAMRYHAAHSNIDIAYNYNGSQILAQQLNNGAPADVFASADLANMQKAAEQVKQYQIFAKNKLTVIVPASNPANITTLQDLAKKGVKIDVAASSVPVGKYGLQVLDKLGTSSQYGKAYESSVKANFVSQEDNVKAVVQKVALGEADAGIVYLTDVTTAEASKVKMIDIPDNFNVIAQYPIAATKGSAHAADAQAFVQYILSSEGQAILTKYHFIGVNG